MNLPDFGQIFDGIGRALDLVGRDPVRFIFGLCLLTVMAAVYGDALKTALDKLQRALATPDDFSKAMAPLLEQIRPWNLLDTVGKLLGHLDPVLGAPLRGLARIGTVIGRSFRSVRTWPVSQSVTPVGSTVQTLSQKAEGRLTGWSRFLQRLLVAGIAELRGPSGTWAGWRTVAAVLLLIVSAAFWYADAGIAIRTHMSATNEPVQELPAWLIRNLPVQFAIASFGSALALGLVLFDLLAMTQLAPWERLAPKTRKWLIGACGFLLALALTLAALVAMWRADQLMDETWLSPELRKSALGLGLTLPIVLLLCATALTTWSVVAAGALVILSVCAVLIALVEVLRVMTIVVTAMSGHLGDVVGLLARTAATTLLVIAMAVVAMAAVPTYGIVVLGTLLLTVTALVGMSAWWIGWTGLSVASLLIDFQARATGAAIELLKALIDVLRAPVTFIRSLFTPSSSPPPPPPPPPSGGAMIDLDVAVAHAPSMRDGANGDEPSPPVGAASGRTGGSPDDRQA